MKICKNFVFVASWTADKGIAGSVVADRGGDVRKKKAFVKWGGQGGLKNLAMILIGILGFVASFAVSLGPVMWVLFSELFPNQLRGLAISFVGLVNSAVSFGVQLVFPWELETLGNSMTFLIYGIFSLIGLIYILRILPETKGRSLEELQEILVKH